MQVTNVKVFPVDEDRLKAYVTIVFDDCFVVHDAKVINGPSGLFVAMPSKRTKNGTYRDTVHPLNQETREMIEQRVLEKYREDVGNPPPLGGPPTPPTGT
ncbi:MAG: septation regulator SpoVG [Chrysiogenetes bacterium]|nr:septation regulator SpoVG [Chrysiogenetes bacterium]